MITKQTKQQKIQQKIEAFNAALDDHIEKNDVKINDIDRQVLKIYYKRHIENGFIKGNTIEGIIKRLGLKI